MKNQERVWKAEQADASEKRKMMELQREIQNERDREELKKIGQSSGVLASSGNNMKLEWMYKGQALNREDYLTGRAIDKHFEQEDVKEKETTMPGLTVHKNHVEHECIPFSIRNLKNADLVSFSLGFVKIKFPLTSILFFYFSQWNKLIYNEKLWKIH